MVSFLSFLTKLLTVEIYYCGSYKDIDYGPRSSDVIDPDPLRSPVAFDPFFRKPIAIEITGQPFNQKSKVDTHLDLSVFANYTGIVRINYFSAIFPALFMNDRYTGSSLYRRGTASEGFGMGHFLLCTRNSNYEYDYSFNATDLLDFNYTNTQSQSVVLFKVNLLQLSLVEVLGFLPELEQMAKDTRYESEITYLVRKGTKNINAGIFS